MNRLISASVLLTLTLAACGRTQPSAPATTPDAAAPTAPSVQVTPGIVFDETQGTRLFTGQMADGLLDFKLHLDTRGAVRTLNLDLPARTIIIGAAFKDEQTAYVAARTATETGDTDRIFEVNLKTLNMHLVSDEGANRPVGIEINSITYKDGTLRYFSLTPKRLPDGELESHLTLFRAAGGTSFQAVGEDTAEAKQFAALMVQAGQRDLAAQQLRPQAGAPFLRFPKTLASRNVPGSSFHTGQDLYAVDLNRDSGDMDLGDGVVAAASGQVTQSANVGSGYGEYITVRHANGLTTAYAHLDKRVVSTGVNVYEGQYIGNVGKSGGQTYAHLHFVLRNGTSPLQVASSTYPMKATYGGVACPLTSFPNETNVSPATC